MHRFLLSTSFLFLLITSTAQQAVNGKLFSVNIRLAGDAEMLNPVIALSADAEYVMSQMFQSLTGYDPYTLQEIPVLAKALPLQLYDAAKNETTLTYEIRPEATWEDGEAITAQDVVFSLKAIKCPGVDALYQRSYFENVVDITIYPENARKLTFVCAGNYNPLKETIGTMRVLPQYIYDPEYVLSSYSIKDLDKMGTPKPSDKKLGRFIEEFNSEKFKRDKEFISGSGAYKLHEWVTGEKIQLVRKRNWWGNNLKDQVGFEAYPDTLTYLIIEDETEAIAGLNNLKLDVMAGFKSATFLREVKTSEQIRKYFNLYTPDTHAYSYIALNTASKQLSDAKVRQALSYLTDVDAMLENIANGMGRRTVGPFSSVKKNVYNDTLPLYNFNPTLAARLLAEAGWKDTNADGVLDKEIDGAIVNMELILIYPAGNEQRKEIGEYLKNEAAKLGINIVVTALDWTVYLDRNNKHDFDLCIGAWLSSSSIDDPKQVWHTASYTGGSNYVRFGDAESDKLIEQINTEPDAAVRKHLYDKLQVIIHKEGPYIFLWSTKERIAISKKFANAEPFTPRPGYNPASFKLN